MAAWIRCSRVMLAVLIVAIFVESASAAGCGWNSSTYGLSSTFGGLGVENALFSPGALDGHAMWVDPVSGNLYLFGGTDLSSEPQSALWRYNITSGLWALLGGDVSPPAGSPVGSQAGWPAGTAWAGVAQLPNGDALIVMGTGSTVGDIVHSSVWRYSITSSSWTLLSGKANAPLVATIKSTVGNTTVYSSAAAAAGYAPNGRSRHACEVDGEGRLWIYGGTGYGTFYGDVWSFDLATAAWTYWGGVGDTTAARNYTPTYTGPASTPNIRDSQRWVWLRNKLWMFGGDNEECYADLWTFDTASPASGWTFVGGAQGNSCLSALGGSFPPGCSTPPCVCPAGSAGACFPPTRDLFAMWTNGDDALFVYGGYDWAAGLSADQAPWDDVWVYNITTQLWMWFAGSPNPGNMPNYSLHRPGGRSGGFFAYSLQRSLIYIACGVQGDRNRASDLWVAPLCLFGSLVPVCSPPTPPYPGSVCTSQGWIVPGTLQLPPGSTTPITGVVVVGGFVLPPSAVIEIVGGSGIIQSSGAVTLNGTVVVVINTDPGSDISIPLVSAGTVNLGPQFALQVNKNFTGCRHVSGQASYSQGTLSALIDVGGCGSKRLATGAIIGIVVAGAVAIAVIVILLIVLAKCGRANRLFGTKQEIGDIR